ncbi:MAG: helix-turn-helix-domain containing protein AraC type [Ramlibacter sp.]|nr:helix-turn-helix-domain containing protein AraC type [Ramlibacter sp.]
MYFVRAAVARLTGAERARVLQLAGIPPDLLATPQARVPAGAFAALWLAVARECDDEFFRLDRRRMKAGSFALLCHAAIGVADVDRALKQILRGFSIFLDDVAGEVRLEQGQAVLTIANRIEDPDARRFADETFLVMVHGLVCWLAGRRIPLAQADFAYPRPPHAQEYTVMYCEQIRFDAGESTSIRFDASHLSLPVVQQARNLKQFLRTAPQSVFLKYKNEESWAARVRRRLRGTAAGQEWPVLETVAQEFHVAPTTLRRRLEGEGVSYQSIKDELRRDFAIDWLSNSPLSIAEVAALVGFEDPSAFYRAFRKWTGVAPGAYRASLAD